MKYFVIAALLSQASAADGCKGDLKGEVFAKAGCEGKPSDTFTFKKVEGTGKCVPHKPTAATVKTEEDTKEPKEKTAKIAKAAAELRDAQESLFVCSEMKKDGKFCDNTHRDDVAAFFGVKYTELKKKYVAYKDAEKAYETLKTDIKSDTTKFGKLKTYKTKLDAYNEFVAVADHEEDITTFDPAVQMIIDAKKAEIEADLTATGLDKDQKKVLTTLENTHSDYLLYK